jgi:hypothetical protein
LLEHLDLWLEISRRGQWVEIAHVAVLALWARTESHAIPMDIDDFDVIDVGRVASKDF